MKVEISSPMRLEFAYLSYLQDLKFLEVKNNVTLMFVLPQQYLAYNRHVIYDFWMNVHEPLKYEFREQIRSQKSFLSI